MTKGRLSFFSSIGLSLMKAFAEVHIYLNISVHFMYGFIISFKCVHCFLIKVIFCLKHLNSRNILSAAMSAFSYIIVNVAQVRK